VYLNFSDNGLALYRDSAHTKPQRGVAKVADFIEKAACDLKL
jgi:hypothetical protein